MKENKTDEFYSKLLGQLKDTNSWPSDYLFKFIVPSSNDKIEAINNIFNEPGAQINHRQSSKGTYTSVSVKMRLERAEDVIVKYKEVSVVEGVISL
jgi:putative lipoic acid-binding regulatory protein